MQTLSAYFKRRPYPFCPLHMICDSFSAADLTYFVGTMTQHEVRNTREGLFKIFFSIVTISLLLNYFNVRFWNVQCRKAQYSHFITHTLSKFMGDWLWLMRISIVAWQALAIKHFSRVHCTFIPVPFSGFLRESKPTWSVRTLSADHLSVEQVVWMTCVHLHRYIRVPEVGYWFGVREDM